MNVIKVGAALCGAFVISCNLEKSVEPTTPLSNVESSANAGALLDKIENSQFFGNDQFGAVVTKVGSNFVVGARFHDVGAFLEAGMVRLYSGTDRSLLADIPNPSPASTDSFGRVITAVGANFVVGVPQDNPGGINDAGSVYLYDGATGALIQEIGNPSPVSGGLFGEQVIAVGSNFVVSAKGNTVGGFADAGAAYLFDSTGTLIQAISDPAPAAGDGFGSSLLAMVTTFVVGAEGEDAAPTTLNSGSVSLFNATTGALVTIIANPDPAASELFGANLTRINSNFVVSVPVDDPGGVNDAGSIYVFNGTTGAIVATIPNPAPDSGDHFGAQIVDGGTNFAVSAPQDNPGGVSDAGTVYVFNASTGAAVTTISNPDPATGDRFGDTLAVSGAQLIIGAPFDDPGAVSDAGSVYTFVNGLLRAAIPNPHPAVSDRFGLDVTKVGTNHFVVQAPFDIPEGTTSFTGSVYLFGPNSNLVAYIPHPDLQTGDLFGQVICDLSTSFVVGVPFYGVADVGAVYVFNVVQVPNQTPTATNDAATVAEDVTLSIPMSTLLANDDDLDGDALTVTAVTSADGDAVISGSEVRFTPAANFFGAASFTYTVRDPAGAVDTGTVNVTVTPVNDAPVAFNVSASTAEDTPVSFYLSASDVEGDVLTWILAVPSANGAVAGFGGSRTFIPNLDFNGTAAFAFRVSDGSLQSNLASGTIAVIAVNDSPSPIWVSAPADGSVLSSASATLVVTNSTDVDGQPLTYEFQVDTSPVFGSAQTNLVFGGANGTISFTTAPLAEDTRYYWRARATDGAASSDWVAASFLVNETNSAPTAPTPIDPVGDLVPEDGLPTLTVLNATDAEGDALYYEFEITDDAGTVLETGTAVPEGSNGITTFTVTARLGGGLKRWRARATDGATPGPWSSEATFEVNKDAAGGCGCTVADSRRSGLAPAAALFLVLGVTFRRRRS